MKIEIRSDIGISMFNCVATKKNGCLIPELWNETHRETRNGTFRENAMFLRYYRKFQCLHILSSYVKLTHVLVKRQLESWQRQLEKTAVVKAGAYIVHVSIDRKTTVYRLEACEIVLTENAC